jgi:two-component system, OmpR family, sensor histidine kinase KdpD
MSVGSNPVFERFMSSRAGVRTEQAGPMFSIARRARVVAVRLLTVLCVISAVTFLCLRLRPVNGKTAGFIYLIAVLLIAAAWGIVEATAASVVAMLCFNYFFLPPVRNLTIADPQNWAALFAFLATSIVASHLSARAKQRTRLAVDRQLEMERLYALSRAILLTEANRAAPKRVAHQIAQIFDLPSVALYDRDTGEVYHGGPEDLGGVDEKLKQAALQGTLLRDESARTVVTAVRLGGEPIGSLAVRGSSLSDTALQAIANLVAIGLEKVRGQEAASRAEAARQSEELKSTLLDAIAHEFKTPLTSIKAAASALLTTPAPKPEEQRELVTIVDEEADRLGRLVTEVTQMARIEAGKIQLDRKQYSVSDLVSGALRQVKPIPNGRQITVEAAENLPLVSVDAGLIELAIRQLLDNAFKYSTPGSPLSVVARSSKSALTIAVRDHGPGIPERDLARIFERFYRGPGAERKAIGAGMGLAITREILRAHDGDVSVKSQPGEGSEFSLSLPFSRREEIA